MDLSAYRCTNDLNDDTSLYFYDRNVKDRNTEYEMHSYIFFLNSTTTGQTGHYKCVIKQNESNKTNEPNYILIDDDRTVNVKHNMKSYLFPEYSDPDYHTKRKNLLNPGKLPLKYFDKNSPVVGEELKLIQETAFISSGVCMIFMIRKES
jgi:hypothetical protein